MKLETPAFDLMGQPAGPGPPGVTAAVPLTWSLPACRQCTDGVSIPELKKSTNFKMHLKPSVQNVWQNLDSAKYTVVGTLVGEAVLKFNFGRSLGCWLEGESRRSSLRKSRFARARHSVRKQVAPRFKNGPSLKRQIFKIQARVNPRVNLCQIKTEIISVQHAPQDTCTAK